MMSIGWLAGTFNLSARADSSDTSCELKLLLAHPSGAIIEVRQSQDAGGFYCEHTLCVNIRLAAESAHIATDARGEPMVGFLHVKRDAHINFPPGTYVEAERHQATRFLVGTAIRGYFATLQERLPEQLNYKLLITGYGPFRDVLNNPTGEFVANAENVDAALALAFGSRQRRIDAPDHELRYAVRVGAATKYISILPKVLDTGDDALNTALPEAIRNFRPHVVVSMGAGWQDVVEVRASNRGLIFRDGRFVHDADSAPTVEYQNSSLWQALVIGSQLSAH